MKRLFCILLTVLLFTIPCSAAYSPYYTYNYDSNLDAVPAAASYLPEYSIGSGENAHISLVTPSDLEIEGDRCYIADTGNNRVLVLDISDRKPEVVYEISSFQTDKGEDALKQPMGVCVANGELYVADTENHRLVIFNLNGEFIDIVPQPSINSFAVEVEYRPFKVGVDSNDRIYVVGLSVTEGIIQLDRDGNFIRFFGSNRVTVDFYELMLRFFLTKQQQAKRLSFVPVEYSNLAIDSNNFVYVTSKTDTLQVKKLNTSGINILRTDARTEDVYGDINKRPAEIVDVTIDQSENIFILDNLRCRVFQYNQLGDLLAVFGSSGDSVGCFTTPTAIDCTADGRIFVSDSAKNTITVFQPTDFGKLVNEANKNFVEGDFQSSMEIWKQVLTLDSNFDLAYVGLGHSYMQTGDYKKAIDCYKKGKYKDGYSDAFAEYRTELLSRIFPYAMTALAVLIVLLILLRKRLKTIPAKIRNFVNP